MLLSFVPFQCSFLTVTKHSIETNKMGSCHVGHVFLVSNYCSCKGVTGADQSLKFLDFWFGEVDVKKSAMKHHLLVMKHTTFTKCG